MEKSTTIPLAVDLDHSLINTDLSVEAAVSYIKSSPFAFIQLLLWWRQGRSYMKTKLAESLSPDYRILPQNKEVVDFVQQQSMSRRVLLVTGSPQKFANEVLCLFPFIKEAYGSSHQINLISHNKADFLVKEFGEKGFDYLGDSKADLNVFPKARNAYVVNSRLSYQEKVPNKIKILKRKELLISDLFFRYGVPSFLFVLGFFCVCEALGEKYFLVNRVRLTVGLLFVFLSGFLFIDFVQINRHRANRNVFRVPLADGSLSYLKFATYYLSSLGLGLFSLVSLSPLHRILGLLLLVLLHGQAFFLGVNRLLGSLFFGLVTAVLFHMAIGQSSFSSLMKVTILFYVCSPIIGYFLTKKYE